MMTTLVDHLVSIGPVDTARLDREPITRLAVERILTQLVDLSVDINSHIAGAVLGRAPERFRDSFDLVVQAGALSTGTAAALKGAVGLRNVLVHEYLQTDYSIVAGAVPQAVQAFSDYVGEIAGWTSRQGPT
jgi:uncharacterized protein YutE (UPF0331/DUF86 family)